MPPRDEATDKELGMIGKLFRDDGTLWRVDDVYFEYKAKCPLTGYQRGGLAVLHHDVDAHGDECPGDTNHPDTEWMELDKFLGYFKKGAEWVKAPEA